MFRLAAVALLLAGCLQQDKSGNRGEAVSWAKWHADKQRVETDMSGALNNGPRPDFPRAIAILRASDWPAPIKDLEGGMMIMQSYDNPKAIRSTETIQQGLALVERSASAPGETPGEAAQQLRIIFERGLGKLPDGIAADRVVADCWRKRESSWDGKRDVPGIGNPGECVALRKQRLPHPGR